MATITFRVSDAEARSMRASARKARMTLSEFIRKRAAGKKIAAPRVGLMKCSMTGAKIFVPDRGLPPLNTESVREMLADFP